MIFLLAFSSETEKDKFEYLYAKYKQLLLKKAWEIVKDSMLAEDAVSEAYLRIYKNLHKIDDLDSPRTAAFLVTIVKNTALTILCREKNTETQPYEEDRPDEFDLEYSVLAGLSSERIYSAMNELGGELRDIFLLKFAYDLPHKKIAQIMRITENNVTVKLHRAKKKLAAILVREGY